MPKSRFSEERIGSGAYSLSEVDRSNREIRFQLRGDHGEPAFSEVVVRYYDSRAHTIEAFRDGEVDAVSYLPPMPFTKMNSFLTMHSYSARRWQLVSSPRSFLAGIRKKGIWTRSSSRIPHMARMARTLRVLLTPRPMSCSSMPNDHCQSRNEMNTIWAFRRFLLSRFRQWYYSTHVTTSLSRKEFRVRNRYRW